MAYVVLSSFRLTPQWLYGIRCLFVYLSLLDASAASGRFILSSPNASVAILAFFVCLFVVCSSPQAPEAIWHVMFVCCLSSPDVSMVILAFVLYVSPDASLAIWLMLFCRPFA